MVKKQKKRVKMSKNDKMSVVGNINEEILEKKSEKSCDENKQDMMRKEDVLAYLKVMREHLNGLERRIVIMLGSVVDLQKVLENDREYDPITLLDSITKIEDLLKEL